MPESRSDDLPLTVAQTGKAEEAPTAAQLERTTGWAGTAPAAAETVVSAVPGYEVLGPLGRGGMGVVYKARQVALNRLVALKVIHAGGAAGEEEQLRFGHEAEAAARIRHPGVVQIYEVGRHEGVPFLALEYCPGGSLARQLDGTPLPPARAAELVEQLAHAVAAAHQAGIVHRDLKPGNVLLSEDGRLKVADFGLAKLLDLDTGQTQTGAILGTASYMAPEQAGGQSRLVGPAADVYALGAILYELLTGRPPFKGATVLETLEQVRSQEPVSPRSLQPRVPRDLETICLKCLHKEPARRYGSAADLAEDLRRFRAGEPILARPVGRLERAVKWARRKPALASLLVVMAVSIASVLLLLEKARRDADANAATQTGLRLESDEEKKRAGDEKRNAERQRDRAELVLHINRLSLAQREAADGGFARALDILEECRWDLRGWEWRHLRRRCAAAVEPRRLLRHRSLVTAVCWDPHGRRLAAAVRNGTLVVWDARAGGEVFSIPKAHQEAGCVAFSPDGRRLASGGSEGAVKLWDAGDGRPVRVFQAKGVFVNDVCFSPDGRRLASAGGMMGKPGELRVWDAGSGEPALSVAGALPPLSAIAFSPDGLQLAAGSSAGGVLVYDAGTGARLRRLDFPAVAGHGLCYSPDGILAAAGSSRDVKRFTETGMVRTWDARSGQERRLIQVRPPCRGVCFSPDGRCLACGIGTPGYPGEVKVWDAETGAERQTFRDHLHAIPAVAFSPDGQWLASASSDWTVRIWDARDEQACQTFPAPATSINDLGFSPDGRGLNSIGADGQLHHFDLRTGRETLPAAPLGRNGTLACVSRDGRRLAGLGADGTVKIRDAATNKALLTIPVPPQCNALALASDGLLLATSGRGAPRAIDPGKAGRITLWDAATGRSLRDWPLPRGELAYCCFSPSGGLLAGVSSFLDSGLSFAGSDVHVWDTTEGTERLSLTFPKVYIRRVGFSPDGARLAVVGGRPGGQPGLVKLWDLATGAEWRSLRGHTAWVEDVCFSPDGTRLATASGIWDLQHRNYASGEVKLWDIASGQETLSLRSQRRWPVRHVAFSPDGGLLATGDADGLVRLWHGGDPWQARPLRRATGDIQRVGFRDDGRLIATAQLPFQGGGGGADEPPAPELFGWDTRTGEEVPVAKESMPAEARQAVSPDGALHAATDGTEVRVWRRADGLPDGEGLREDEQLSLAWHFRQAAESEKAGQWFAARFHLDRLLAALPDDAALKARRAAAVAAQAKARKSKPNQGRREAARGRSIGEGVTRQ